MGRRIPQVLLLLALGGVCLLLWDAVIGPALESGAGVGDGAYESGSYLDAASEAARRDSDGPSLSGIGSERRLGADGRAGLANADGSAGGKTGAGGVGKGQVAFEGRVLGSGGGPASGVKITLHGPGGVDKLETDAGGRFAAGLQPGRYKILFEGGRDGGLMLRQYMVDGAPKEDLEFALREPGAIDVEIKRGDEFVVAAPIVLTAVGLEDLARFESMTDQTGHAKFEDLVPGRYDIEAQVPEGPLVTHATYAPSASTRNVKVRVPDGVVLKGTVRVGKDGPGVGAAQILLETSALKGDGRYTTTFETRPDGTYELMVPQGRPRKFTVAADGYAPWPTSREMRGVLRSLRRLTGKKPVTRNVILKGGAVLSGIVQTEEEQPIPGVILRFKAPRVEPVSVTTKGDGTYALASLNPGRYDLQVETQAYFPVKGQPLRVFIPGGADPKGTTFDVTLVGARRLEGIVVDGQSKGVVGARVWIVGGGRVVRSARNAGRLLETFTDMSGKWVISDIPPDKNVTVRAAMGLEEAKPVYARWEKPPPSPIRMMLQDTGTMEGSVVDIITRTNVRGVLVRLQPDVGDGRTPRQAYTNAKGEFSIVGLLPGAWRVTPYKKGYLRAGHEIVQVSRGDDVRAQLNLDPGQVFGGTIVNEAGQPLRGTRVSVRGIPAGKEKPVSRGASADARGKFRITGLEHGVYTVTAWRKGYRAERARDLSHSATELRFVLRKPKKR